MSSLQTSLLATNQKIPARFKELRHMIGNTPLLAIHFTFHGKRRVIHAKAEHINMTGSIKDRMAFQILKKAYQEERIHPGDTIVEATSGNTGISFAAIGRALGHQVVIFMPDWMSQERVALIRSLGAKIVPGQPRSGRISRKHSNDGGTGATRAACVPAQSVYQQR